MNKNQIIRLLKLLLIILTVIFPLVMVSAAGIGLVYNSDSYGSEIKAVGLLFILSGILMTVGSVMVCIGKNIPSVIFSSGGFILCMIMLFKIMNHADSAGWSDNYTLEPVSDMYFGRIFPVIVPFLICVGIAVYQIVTESKNSIAQK